jgi:hypothetical protein
MNTVRVFSNPKNRNLGGLTDSLQSVGNWVTGATSDINNFLKNSGLVELATDISGLISAYNNVTGQNVSKTNLSSSQQQQLQSIINTKNVTGQYTNAQIDEISAILSGKNSDISKYLPYIVAGGLFIILLVVLMRK